MRHGSGGRRSRNRGNNNRRKKRNKQTVYDSNGPDVRVRGTAHQVRDKYVTLAKDASSTGDDILSISYLQHAEHYERLINDWEDTRHDIIEEMRKEKKARGSDEQKQNNTDNSQRQKSRRSSHSKKKEKELENA